MSKRPEALAILSEEELAIMDEQNRKDRAIHCVLHHAMEQLVNHQIKLHSEHEKETREYELSLARKYGFSHVDQFAVNKETGEVFEVKGDEPPEFFDKLRSKSARH